MKKPIDWWKKSVKSCIVLWFTLRHWFSFCHERFQTFSCISQRMSAIMRSNQHFQHGKICAMHTPLIGVHPNILKMSTPFQDAIRLGNTNRIFNCHRIPIVHCFRVVALHLLYDVVSRWKLFLFMLAFDRIEKRNKIIH